MKQLIFQTVLPSLNENNNIHPNTLADIPSKEVFLGGIKNVNTDETLILLNKLGSQCRVHKNQQFVYLGEVYLEEKIKEETKLILLKQAWTKFCLCKSRSGVSPLLVL